jgi:hypothetical protein
MVATWSPKLATAIIAGQPYCSILSATYAVCDSSTQQIAASSVIYYVVVMNVWLLVKLTIAMATVSQERMLPTTGPVLRVRQLLVLARATSESLCLHPLLLLLFAM